MNTAQDYDNDGNNIVPCPICDNVYCPSKEKGKCPEEDDFIKEVKAKNTMNEYIQEKIKEFVEKGAELEHDRWSKWQEYMHSILQKDISDNGFMRLPDYYYSRLERQIKTKYSELSEKEKESDRIEVKKYLPLLEQFLQESYNRGVEDSLKCVPRPIARFDDEAVGDKALRVSALNPILRSDMGQDCYDIAIKQTIDNISKLLNNK